MRFVSTTLIAALTFTATIVLAADATDPTVKARQELMDVIGMNTKVLGEMASGKAAFDAAAAKAAKDALIAAAAEIPAKFEPQATDPATKAKAEIWADFAKFKAEADELSEVVADLDTASVDTVKAGMGAVGAVCKDCHTAFRN